MTQTATIDAVMRTLADPTRRAVFERIVGSDEITVVELTRGSGVTQGAISQHLKSLKQAGLVTERPEGGTSIIAPSLRASRRSSIG
jgi:DNA-binding transcriptional ArsR family regulator